jgi:CBS-domain-containing membrane protein
VDLHSDEHSKHSKISKAKPSTSASTHHAESDFSLQYDADHGFPETPDDMIVDWRLFNKNLESSEPDISKAIEVIKNNPEQKIDLRPYMIEYPMTVRRYESLINVVEKFRQHNLRTLPVVSYVDQSLIGIITRKDLFAYMTKD